MIEEVLSPAVKSTRSHPVPGVTFVPYPWLGVAEIRRTAPGVSENAARPPREVKLRTLAGWLVAGGFAWVVECVADGRGVDRGVRWGGRGVAVSPAVSLTGRGPGLAWMIGPTTGIAPGRSKTAPRRTSRTPSQESTTARPVAPAHMARYVTTRRIST